MRNNEKQSLLLHNRFDEPKELWIEPWGDNIILPPNSTFLVIGEGPSIGSLEIDLNYDGFTIYGWSRSTLTILDEQENVVWYSSIPVP